MKFARFGILAALYSAVAALSACSDDASKKAQTQAPPPKVTVAKPVKKLITDPDEYVGRFVAFDYVEVRARVSGYLEKIQFTDGQYVNKGDPLFSIDNRQFVAARDQAQAALAQAKSSLDLAENELKRGESLVRGSTITQQTFDQRAQAQRNAEGAVAAQEAAVRQTELDLSFTELVAPISGRIGDRRVSVGNLVTGGAGGSTTLLATIASTDPIRFEFTLDENSYLRYVRERDRIRNTNSSDELIVKLKLLDETGFTHDGKLDFIDNTIDNSTGTIRGRAIFPNPKGLFTPGMFGRVQISPSAPAEALLVPDTAVGTEQVRKFVYALNAENVASVKYVTLGPVVDGLRVVKDGISADDRVIVNGLMRVRPGAKVTPEEATANAAAPAQQAKSE